MTADEHSGGSKDSDLATICVALIERKEELAYNSIFFIKREKQNRSSSVS